MPQEFTQEQIEEAIKAGNEAREKAYKRSRARIEETLRRHAEEMDDIDEEVYKNRLDMPSTFFEYPADNDAGIDAGIDPPKKKRKSRKSRGRKSRGRKSRGGKSKKNKAKNAKSRKYRRN